MEFDISAFGKCNCNRRNFSQEVSYTPKPVWTTWRRENSWPYWDSNPLVVQSVATRYNNCAIPAPEVYTYELFIASQLKQLHILYCHLYKKKLRSGPCSCSYPQGPEDMNCDVTRVVINFYFSMGVE
jgi:hypothetical protein